jgi:hypothetical protein
VNPEVNNIQPNEGSTPKVIRAGLQIIGGAVPFAGGLFSAAAGAWSENEQEKVNKFFKQWLKMLEDEIKEKEQTVLEIMARLDMHDEKATKRLESKEYQSLLKKTFREWSGAESEDKRKCIRNILANAAATTLTSDAQRHHCGSPDYQECLDSFQTCPAPLTLRTGGWRHPVEQI